MSKITVTELQGHTSGGDANKVKIATGHNLGVNTGSGSIDARLHVESHSTGHIAKFEGVANSQNHRVIIDASGTSSTTGLQMSNSNSNNAGSFYWSGGNNALYLQVGQTAGSEPTSGTNALAVDSTGRHMLPAGIVLGNGSTYAAANHLNDYEEGTWTPILVSTGATFAYSVQQGIYTKIGDLVTFNCVIQLDGGGNSFTGNSVALNGWPFASRNAQGAASRFFIYGRYLNLDAGNGYTYAYADLAGNSSSAPLKEGGDNTPTNNLASNDLSSSSGQLYLHGHYYTDS